MFSQEEILDVLKKWNYWEKESNTGILREQYTRKISEYLDTKEVLFLKGIRRSGKSTIMKQLMKSLYERGVDKKRILYINLEDVTFLEQRNVHLLEVIYQTFQTYSNSTDKLYLFLDEIQVIESWEQWVRTYYDREENVKFVISGSNASLLSGELATKLTGRQRTFYIKPLSYSEYGTFVKNPSIEEYLEYGGFPEVVLQTDVTKKRELLQDYFDDVLNKDVIARYAISNTDAVHAIAKIVLGNSGGKVSFNKIAKHLSISDSLVATCIGYMINAFLLKRVSFHSYSITKRHSVLTLPKYYAVDVGFVSIASLGYTKDLGKKYETVVLNIIDDGRSDISYWDGDGEIDFIIENNAITVTFTDDIPEREYTAFKKFKAYDKFIVTKSVSRTEKGITLLPLDVFSLKLLR